MTFTFTAPVFEWRGPAPYVFVAVPSDECEAKPVAPVLGRSSVGADR